MNDKKSFAYKCGQLVSAVLWGCISVSLISIILALTCKFIIWLF